MAEIIGTSDGDILDGTIGDDTITALAGNDTITPGGGQDTIDGGDGIDTVRLIALPDPLIVAGGPLTLYDFYAPQSLVSVERLEFASQAGEIVEAIFSPGVLGSSGLVELVGGAGTDDAVFLVDQPGTYTMPALTLSGWDPAPLNAWEGLASDALVLLALSNYGTDYTLNALAGTNAFQVLVGLDGDQVMNGSDNADHFAGNGGNDQMFGGGGNDMFEIVNGLYTWPMTGEGSTYDGGAGSDVLSIGGTVFFFGTMSNIEGIDLRPEFVPTDPNVEGIPPALLVLDSTRLAMLPANAFFNGTGTVELQLDPGAGFDGSLYTFTAGSDVQFRVVLGSGSGAAVTGTSVADSFTIGGGVSAATIAGGGGTDSYLFWDRGFGNVTIQDFDPGETIDLVNLAVPDFATLLKFAVQDGADTVFDLSLAGQPGVFRLAGVALASLTPGDFVFDPAALMQVGTGAGDTLTGTNDNEILIGLGGSDLLIGGYGMDVLDGSAGGDELRGGPGDDLYGVDSQADLVFEDPGAGYDSVISTGSFYLYDEIENLTLAEGSGDSFGVGNALSNILFGNEGANLLIGGAGDDDVSGDAGNDAIFGEDGFDFLAGDSGTDTIAGGNGGDAIEGGDGADALYGEDGDDWLYGGGSFDTDILVGGAGNDTLVGRSSQANPDYDLMDGGAGDDTYFVDTGADLTFEAIGGGTDTVHADIPVANAGVYLWANVENLFLDGTTAFGVGNELANNIIGSNSANLLLGGAGNDLIEGRGGNDVLFGEAGADTFVFYGPTGQDVIGDFNLAEDVIEFGAYFTSFAQAQGNFVQVGSDGAIDLGFGNFVVLQGVTMANLTAANFVFAAAAEPPAPVKAAASLALPPEPHGAFADHGFERWQHDFAQTAIA
jgi:Ca2+-binding RTX toxin-like protein